MWLDTETDQDPYNRQGNNANNPNNQSSVGSGGGSGPTAGGTNTPSGSNPSTLSPTQSNTTQNFATVQDYLKGNQQQGEDLAGKVTGKLDTDLSNEKGTIDQSAGNVKNQIQSSTPTYDSNLTNEAVNDPTKVTNDPGKLNSFLAQWNASYSGPQNFEGTADYSNAAGAKNEADTRKAEVGSAGGQQQLLHDDFGVYGQGNQGLDQAVLQNSSKYGDVQGYGSKFGGIGDYLNSQSADINSQAANAQSNAADTKSNTRNIFNRGVADLTSKVGNEAQTIKTAGASIPDAARNFLSMLPPNPSDIDLSIAGMTRGEYEGILNSLPIKSSNPNASNPLYAENPQYSQDLSRYLAAQQLQNKAFSSQF